MPILTDTYSMYYALSFYEDVMDKVHKLNDFPHKGRIVPEMDDANVREIFVHRIELSMKFQIHPLS
ncbi:hypothetical protein SY83_04680 [Paenibacillus swuensis]|uniref:Uncharacterized protein n=1 Tax=Paenibacillus swuensis TaxID=1178515 RepID=A0A172TF90_9BACL|nr:hypothetical protein SY83_04680 [Paenibacillus swuensis]